MYCKTFISECPVRVDFGFGYITKKTVDDNGNEAVVFDPG